MPGAPGPGIFAFNAAQAPHQDVMLRRNGSQKSSISKDLMLPKYHAHVAMIRLCDGSSSWFISSGPELRAASIRTHHRETGQEKIR
jgi:hypothetical protein